MAGSGTIRPVVLLLALAAGLFGPSHAQVSSKSYAVMLKALTRAEPPAIKLSWEHDPNAHEYIVARRNGPSWQTVASLDASETSWIDSNLELGEAIEYRVTSVTTSGYEGLGYIYAGVEVPLPGARGTVLLVIDRSVAPELEIELRRFEWDLAGDGWQVRRLDVFRSASVQSVKQGIVDHFIEETGALKAVVLLGHVPVPYSGNFSPDGHSDHRGAWPADAYYGDMDGTWTDTAARNTTSLDPRNWNIPGDGKFDQSLLPSDVDLAVGRIDFHNLPCFEQTKIARTEIDLLRAYLNKNHHFRHKILVAPERAVLADFFGARRGEAFASSGWRNFSPLLGPGTVSEVGAYQLFPKLSQADHLWAYACGGGSFQTLDNVGSSFDFAENEIKAVFTMFVGSYFGDWDNENAFLRSALASGNCLATSWAGRPHWFYHHMGLGEPIGVSTLASQNNRSSGPYGRANNGTRGVHISLLGDPTLRMYPVEPPRNLHAELVGEGPVLIWEHSIDSEVLGYHLYRGSDPRRPFVRLTSEPISTNKFELSEIGEAAVYMVRAVKLQRTSSGSFYHESQGIFSQTAPESRLVAAPTSPRNLTVRMISPTTAELKWEHRSASENSFKLERRAAGEPEWQLVREFATATSTFRDEGLRSGTKYQFRLRAVGEAGDSSPSNEAAGTTFLTDPAPAAVQFIGSDKQTAGNWSGAYGKVGYWIIPGAAAAALPAYMATDVVRRQEHSWSMATQDPRAPERPNSATRVAGCWYSFNWFAMDFTSLDDRWHKLSLYFLDWDRLGRSQRIDLFEPTTGKLLDSRVISNFGDGLYLSWEIRGAVQMRVTVLTGGNAVLSGIFFDPVAVTPPPALVARSAEGKVTLQVNSDKSELADVLASNDLIKWTRLGTITLDEKSATEFVDADSSERVGYRFYRIVPAK
jgi:hypothetical protein